MGSSIDLYVPSLPAIARFFHVPRHEVQFTIGFYMLGYAIAQLLLGTLSDSLGRRKIFVGGGTVYTLASLFAIFSSSIEMLIFYRFLQGCSIGGCGVICRAMVADCFSGLPRVKAMTFISLSWAIGPIIGPFIGGYLQEYFGWQANFAFFFLYALFTFVYALIVLPETHFDLKPIHLREIAKTVWSIVIHPQFIRWGVIASLVYAALVVFNVIAPFLIQGTLHYSAIAYGHIALLLGTGYFLGNLLNFWLVHHFNTLKIILFSLITTVCISLLLLLVGLLIQPNLYILIIPIFFLFCFCGLIYPNMMALSVSLFSKSAGTSSAVFGFWAIGGVTIMSLIASLLGITTQVPLAWFYLGIFLFCIILSCFKTSSGRGKKESS